MVEPLTPEQVANMTDEQKEARLQELMIANLSTLNDESFTDDVKEVLEQNGLHHSDVEKILNEIVLVAQNYFGEVS
jgi:chemotaxis regulatin CheY-phosphate phosphatase CheZ